MTATENYASFFGAQSWTKKEGEYWYEYSVAEFEIDGETETSYIKKLVLSQDGEVEDVDMLSMIFEEFEGSKFSKASILKGEYSISFEVVEEGVTTTMTFKVKDETLKSIVISSGIVSMSINFKFGEDVLSEIPEMPTNVEWYEYEPYIEVDGVKTSYYVGDTLDLEDVVLEFYEDSDDFFSTEEFDVTMDMISGFSTEEAGEYTMTITFYGLTYTIDYTVSEPHV